MESVHAHLKTLSVLLLFVLAFTVFERADTIARFLNSDEAVAAAVNPVASFLGIASDKNSTTSVVNTNTQTQTTDTSLLGSMRSFLNNANPVDVTSTAVPTKNTPTLICAPSITDGVEQTILMWACNNGAQKATGTNFNTDDAPIGSLRVQAANTTTYGVSCEGGVAENTTATCTVRVAEPVLLMETTEKTVPAGNTATIMWTAGDVRSCELSSDYDTTFTRTGITGSAITHAIYEDTTFTLTCEATTGLQVKKTATIRLR